MFNPNITQNPVVNLGPEFSSSSCWDVNQSMMSQKKVFSASMQHYCAPISIFGKVRYKRNLARPGFPTGAENIGGLSRIWWKSLESIHGGTWGGLKQCSWNLGKTFEKYLWRSSLVSKDAGYKPANLHNNSLMLFILTIHYYQGQIHIFLKEGELYFNHHS